MKRLFRTCMPYCIQKQKDGKYVLLNRDYKPVGFNTSEGIRYEAYPIGYELKKLIPEIAAELSWNGDPNLTSIYLYNDGTVPTDSNKNMEKYLKRLELLMSLEIDR